MPHTNPHLTDPAAAAATLTTSASTTAITLTGKPALRPMARALAGLGLLAGLSSPGGAQTPANSAVPAAASTTAAAPAASSTVRTLIDQARHWQQRQRADLAAQAWQKLLAVDPRQPDALHGMAVLSAEAGRFEEAGAYLNRLRQVRPDHPSLVALTKQVQGQKTSQSMLATARQYAQSGQTEAAARAYRQAMGNEPPPDELALEYYQTLGGTREGWDEAKHGLERIVQAQPAQAGPALAYAKHLSYRESTRRDAIGRLIALSNRADAPAAVQQDARAAWRQALLWLGARPADAGLYRQYLSSVGDDVRVRARLDEVGHPGTASGPGAGPALAAAPRQAGRAAVPAATLAAATAAPPATPRGPDPQQQALKEAYATLNSGDAAAAAERFDAVLKRRTDDPEALAGLGIARMRQERFDEAVELLGRAADGPTGARWKPLQRTAQHWQAVHEADAARQSGDLDRAAQLARAAVEADPKEPEGQVLLGDLLAGQGQMGPAESAYRAALRQESRHPRATVGLISVVGASGRTEQAQTLIQQLDSDLLGRLGGPPMLRAAQMRLQADVAQQRNDVAGARALLEQAVTVAPASPWVRLSLGQLLVRQGKLDEARAQVDAFVIPAISSPGKTEALQARATLQSDLKDWTGALQTLEQVPPRERKGEIARLQRRLAVQAQAADAVALARSGQTARAQALLAEAETAAGQDPEMVGAVAGARMDLGEDVRAGQLIRATLAAQPQAGPGLRLRHAALLLQTRQDAELAGVLRQLGSLPLTAGQRRDYDDLRLGSALRQADLLRENGDVYGAWEAIGPLLQERPNDPRLQMSLARMHSAAGDEKQARALYEAVLQQRPDNVDAWLGMAGASDALKDHATAAQALEQANRLAPDNARVLAQYARHHRAQGQFGKAGDYLRAAMAAEQAGRLQWGQARSPGNPFVTLAGEARLRAAAPGAAQQPFLPRVPVTALAAAPMNYDQLPPTGAGLPGAGGLMDSPLARSQQWRQPVSQDAAGTRLYAAAPQAGSAMTAQASPLMSPIQAPRRARTLADELAEVQTERGRTHIGVGGTFTSRSGEAGLTKLDMVQTPVEGHKVIEDVGRVTARIIPVVVNAGQAGDAGARARTGTLALDPAGTQMPVEQSDAGVGLSVGLQTRTITADIGTTPVGFAVVDMVGGVRYSDALDDRLKLTLEASRRAMTDSVLSFAGSTDPRTGQRWGGVRATGVAGQLAWEQDDLGFYGYGSAHALTGRQVANNSRIEIGTGGYWRGQRNADDEFTVGMNLGYQHHQRNLRGTTWGQGGYFSPQHMLSLTLPVNWVGRTGRLSWGMQGAAGLQVYRESASPYFPTDAAAQSALESLVAQQKATASAYAARSETGMVFNLGGALEYQITRQLDIGTRLALERASQFTQGAGSIYVRFSLEPRGGPGGQGLRMPGGPTGY